ncbi:sensor histidine kinase [Streptomyces ochraceiscleroticus]|uniref:histidine kinase n=1 Tax=Streptomyces ochraceiscleroticus TaxID=47761 RepID=A0ABW1MIB6_9ACTN|nr:histidine kinase [Streptomyces ochraceiscleroticus]
MLLASAATLATWRRAPYPPWLWLPVQTAGVTFVWSGVVLRLRRPANATGRWMILVGFTWYIGDLQLSDNAALFALGFCCFYLSYAALSHLVLALPSGRLRNRYERGVAALLYTMPLVTQGVRYVVEYPPQPQQWGDPQGRYSVWASIGSVFGLALTALTAALVVRRWATAGRPVRRAYAPVWTTMFALGGVVVAATFAALLDAPLGLQKMTLLAYALCMIVTPVALAGGLVRVRMARVRVADLVVRLEESAEPEAVRAAIAEALGDPALELWFPRPPTEGHPGAGYLRTDGAASDVLPGDGRGVTPVVRRGQPLAFLVHDPALREQRPLVDTVLAAAGLALDNARLLAAQRAQLEEIRASRARIALAGDAERQRIQRDLHDGIQHKLLVISILVDRARAAGAAEAGDDGQRPDLASAALYLTEVLHELRALAEGISPPILVEEGLAAAVEALAERGPLPVLACIPHRRWPDHVERTAYFVITEALANTYKHAEATQVRIRADDEPDRLVVEIADDGIGGADPARGTGLRGLEDRVGALDGRLHVNSPPRAGTRLVVELPCAS